MPLFFYRKGWITATELTFSFAFVLSSCEVGEGKLHKYLSFCLAFSTLLCSFETYSEHSIQVTFSLSSNYFFCLFSLACHLFSRIMSSSRDLSSLHFSASTPLHLSFWCWHLKVKKFVWTIFFSSYFWSDSQIFQGDAWLFPQNNPQIWYTTSWEVNLTAQSKASC